MAGTANLSSGKREPSGWVSQPSTNSLSHFQSLLLVSPRKTGQWSHSRKPRTPGMSTVNEKQQQKIFKSLSLEDHSDTPSKGAMEP